MKKKILFVLILAVLFSACKMKLSENIGTVVIDFGGDERAAGSTGLPDIKDAAMSLEINSSSQGTQKIDFAAGQPKTWSGTFPAGEKVTIKVSLSTASAVWKGSAEHTVTEDTNSVSIKLKKSAAALNNLLFGTDKLHGQNVGGHQDYTLTLKIGSKEIKKRRITEPSFCCDNKGRTYLVYTTGNEWKLERYTSEGDYDKIFSVPADVYDIAMLAGDHKTGAVYAVVSTSGGTVLKVCRIQENGNFEEITLEGESEIKIIGNIAVYDNVLIAYIGNSSLTGFKISGNKAKKLKDYANINDDTDIKLGSQNESGHINNLYMTNDSLYVLFSAFNSNSSAYYSLGGIVKYSYTADGTISKLKRIGIKDSHTAQNGFYATDDGNFYNPVKVIGFDEENLYIADDGFDVAMTDAGPKIVKNRNRIAALNMQTNELTFTDAGSAKWYNEWKEWAGVNTKTIVWNKTYDLDSVSSSMEFKKTTFKEHGSSDELFETESNKNGLFAFDQSGVLYIPYTDGSDNKIKRFVRDKDNGTYGVAVGESTFPPSYFPGSMAVDTSRSHSFAARKAGGSSETAYYNVLYCSGFNNDINRFVWTDNFTAAFKDTSYTIQETGWTITALAANKDGLFAALWKRDSSSKTYGIKINRYDKVSKTLSGTVVLVPEDTSEEAGGFKIDEKITDMHIQDGVLYAVTAKEKEESGSDRRLLTSGKLWYVSTTADFGDNQRVLYASNEAASEPDTLEKNFYPCRFIAIKPKKLVIASDGYYGRYRSLSEIKNFDKTVTFDIGSWNDPVGEPVEHTTFTKVLTVSYAYEFLP